jgi:hypothetical protein
MTHAIDPSFRLKKEAALARRKRMAMVRLAAGMAFVDCRGRRRHLWTADQWS